MALAISNAAAPAHINGISAPSPADDEELYAQLMQLQDVVLAGKHPQFKLSQSAVKLLTAALSVPEATVAVNGTAHATNQQQLQLQPPQTQTQTQTQSKTNGLPGLYAPAKPSTNGAVSAYAAKTAGLDPIFLQKSESLVRAEAQLKRQRIERDLQAQVDQRRHSAKDRDPGFEGSSRIDMNAVLSAAWIRVTPASGLKSARAASAESFDENDYYSSQAPSEWSSDPSLSKGSDKGADGFTADSERYAGSTQARPNVNDGSHLAQKRVMPGSSIAHASKDRRHVYTNEPDEVYEDDGDDDEDDEYIPPDAATFKSARSGVGAVARQSTPSEDDNSDYEPGEITHESAVPTPNMQSAQPAVRVPVIRNHLTYIAAPQPNKVSPLATAKAANIELELVNGRPEIVVKPQPQHRPAFMQSRASTASPSGNGGAGSGKKARRTKKRKRDFQNEQSKPAKKGRREREMRDRYPARAPSPLPLPVQQDPYIKDEPVSPPPFASIPQVQSYQQQQQYRPAPAELGAANPGGYQPEAASRMRYTEEPLQPTTRSALRNEYALPASPSAASPSTYRPVQRDTQDLRRVASLQYAQRPTSPPQGLYTPPVGQYRAASAVYGEPRSLSLARAPDPINVPNYREVPPREEIRYVRAPSPPRVQEYQDPYSRAQSPAMMAPPPARRIVVDQYGNRYYAAEPAHAPLRASMAPVERRPEPAPMYERAPSRMSVAYAPQPQSVQYEPVDARMAPSLPPPPRREPPVEYVDANGYRVVREYSTRPAEPMRYAEQPTSPVYQQAPRYESMLPPAAPTSPVYQQAPRYESMLPPPTPASPVYQQSARYEAMPPPPAPTSPVYQQSARYQAMPPPPAPSERTSPVYRQSARYEDMPPPLQPHHAQSIREPTSPVYQQQPSRAYSVRPEEPPHPSLNYIRQPSVAPIQYARQEMAPPPPPSARAGSVMPGSEYGVHPQQQQQQQQMYGYAQAPPPPVKYVDQYGREVFAQQVRQVSEFRY